jgi:signal transduction histidine kinase
MSSTPFARLLIVDDEGPHMHALCKTLELEGYHTTGFTSANEALAALHGGEFDLLLTDLNMPEMDGISMLQAALAVDGDLACIMMTGQGSIPTAVNAMQVGALDYILKPFKPSVIVPVLARALGLRRLRMENAELGRRLRERTHELEAANQRVEKQHRLLAEIAAEAESANGAKSTFLSTMSHEIRTPLNAILGYAQLMARDPDLSSDSKSNLNVICRSGEHLLGLINDVLDVSKIEAGRMELHLATFSLPGLLKDLAAMFRLRAEAKMLRFVMVVGGESVPYVVADEGKIRQTLINLLGNAIKFTNQGQIRLHVTVEQKDSYRLWLSARVEDTGSGIT